jgi:hypothetical protein
MSLVRRALIAASGLDAAMSERLLDPKYDEPRGLVPAIQFVRGMVRASDPSSPPALDMGAIELDWTDSRPVASKKENGRVDITLSSNVKLAAIQAGVELDLDERGMRAAHIAPTGDVETEVHSARDGEADS